VAGSFGALGGVRGSLVAVSWCCCSAAVVTWCMQLETAVGDSGLGDVAYGVGSGGDMAVGVNENTLAWTIWALMRGTTGTGMTAGGGWMVVVDVIDVISQCLATGGCQTLKLLIINILIFN
jgi:hypothetical protein